MTNNKNSKILNIFNIIRSISWLKYSNKLIFQWFFIRLTICQETHIENHINSCDTQKKHINGIVFNIGYYH